MEVEGTIASAAPTQISAHLVCLLSLSVALFYIKQLHQIHSSWKFQLQHCCCVSTHHTDTVPECTSLYHAVLESDDPTLLVSYL